MPLSYDDLATAALVLPMEQRLALARQLLESVDLEPAPDAGAAWEEEIAERIALVDSGTAPSIPASEVFARLRIIAPGK